MKQILMILMILLIIMGARATAQTVEQLSNYDKIPKVAYYTIPCNGLYHRPMSTIADMPPIPKHQPGHYIFTREQLAKMPYTNLNDIVSLVAGVYQQQRGYDVNISGGRTDGTLYVLDNMQVMR